MKPVNKTQKNLFTKWKSLFSILLIAAMLFNLTGMAPKKATAASYTVIKVSGEKESAKKTVSGTTITVKRNSDGASYTITTEKKNTKKTITKKSDALCVTDGKSIYYSEVKNDKFTIFQTSISSGSKKKLASGTGCILDSSGRYLYYVTNYSYEEHAGKCHALDLQTKKSTYITKSASIKVIKGNKILINDFHMDMINIAFYTANQNGSGLKLIDKGMVYKVTNSKLYYFKAKTAYAYLGDAKIKKYTCSLTGGNKKAISGWTNKLPSTYEDFQ